MTSRCNRCSGKSADGLLRLMATASIPCSSICPAALPWPPSSTTPRARPATRGGTSPSPRWVHPVSRRQQALWQLFTHRCKFSAATGWHAPATLASRKFQTACFFATGAHNCITRCAPSACRMQWAGRTTRQAALTATMSSRWALVLRAFVTQLLCNSLLRHATGDICIRHSFPEG